jgi:hypothetical protein
VGADVSTSGPALADGAVTFHGALKAREAVQTKYSVNNWLQKSGRSGPFDFIEQRMEIFAKDDDLAVDERRSIIYRAPNYPERSADAAILESHRTVDLDLSHGTDHSHVVQCLNCECAPESVQSAVGYGCRGLTRPCFACSRPPRRLRWRRW